MAFSEGAISLKAVAGGRGGSWFVLMEGIARLVAEMHPAIRIDVVEGGGVMNHSLVGSGEVDLGILNPPMTAAAVEGRDPYDRTYPDLRAGVANLTVNHLHLLVEADSPLQAMDEWINRKAVLNIPVDRVGTVDRLVFRLALEHLGASEKDVEAWGCRLVPAANYDQQLDLYRGGEVNALWQFMGVPSPSVAAANDARPLKLLSLPPTLIRHLDSLGWTADRIPAGAYGIARGAVPTISMGTTLGFHAGVSEEVAHAITGVVCDNPDLVGAIHPAAEGFDPANAATNPRGPVHEGSGRYYREHGIG